MNATTLEKCANVCVWMRVVCAGVVLVPFLCEMLSLLLLSSFLFLRVRGVFVVKREGKNTVRMYV